MLRRSSPPSSQPHHTLQNPVFIQKIVPYAAVHAQNGAVFSSVSSSWQETMRDHGGAVLCWKAFFEASPANERTVAVAFRDQCRTRHNFTPVFEIIRKNRHIRQDILAMLRIFASSADAKSVIEFTQTGMTPIDRSQTSLMFLCQETDVTVADIEEFFGFLVTIGGDEYLRKHLDLKDIYSNAAMHFALKQAGTSLEIFKLFLRTIKEKFGLGFLKQQLNIKIHACAYFLPNSHSPLQFALSSCARTASSDLVQILFDTYEEIGGTKYLEGQLRELNPPSALAADLADGDVDAATLIYSKTRELCGDSFWKHLMKTKWEAKKKEWTLVFFICYGPFRYALPENQCKAMEFLTKTCEDVGGKQFLKEQLESRNKSGKTPFLVVCGNKISSVRLIIHFIKLFKKIGGTEYLRRMMLTTGDDRRSPFSLALKILKDHSTDITSEVVELLASVLQQVGLFPSQFAALNSEKQFLNKYGIDASFSANKIFYGQWFDIEEEDESSKIETGGTSEKGEEMLSVERTK